MGEHRIDSGGVHGQPHPSERKPTVVLALSTTDAEAIADALEMLAGVDEGEHTDYDELVRLSGVVRASMG